MPSSLHLTGKQLFNRLRKNLSLLPPSPTPHLLCSNDPPTDAEESLIQAAILLAENKLQKQDAPISPADKNVKRERELIVRFIASHKVVLSAIRHIPIEVLREIFLFCIQSGKFSISLRLSSVSRRWRDVALSTPELWSQVPKLHVNNATKSKKYISGLKTWLERSGNASLSLFVFAPFKEYKSHPILDIIAEHSERWQHLIIESTCVTIHGLNSVRNRLPRLQTLQLDIWSYSPGISMDAFEFAPRLIDIEIQCLHPPQLRLPWKQIRRYRERCFNGPGAPLSCLSFATNLVHLDLKASHQFPTRVQSHVRLDSLISLRLEAYNQPFAFASILHGFTFPALQELYISSHASNLLIDLMMLISQSSCKLLTLRLDGSFSPGDIRPLLSHVPELKTLQIVDFASQDLEALVYKPGSLPSISRLANLIIRTTPSGSLNTDLLNEVAHSRCYTRSAKNLHPIDPLHSFRIVFPTYRVCREQQAMLEGWNSAVRDTKIDTLVSKWHDCLISSFPQVYYDSLDRDALTNIPASSISKDIQDTFLEMDQFNVRNVNYIYRTGLHIVINELSKMEHLLHLKHGEKGKIIQRRAKELITKWTPQFLADLPKRKWFIRGKYSLVYISEDDGIRKSRDALDIIFGMEDDLHNVELFWPNI
ncbi:hypothetical protein BDQ12DRAFT_730190 [Crucibulum laeve]|uniref:F-box domain-containing protein n=1 Tax=Crucibulum laeve TaxID=68775 RepID=A0A5C3MFE5_9AGAR|nr:hypothetical protein BDQ12DRAFT_730190 [Crucibulum laeve]